MTKSAAVLAVLPALLLSRPVLAADRGEAKATIAGKELAIDYGRPLLNGRDMLAQAQVGAPWRMGADSATTFKTDVDLSFGQVEVPKGEYVLTATKVAEDKWELNVRTKEKGKVADVPLTAAKLSASIEAFTIELKGQKDKGTFTMSWGDIALSAPFTAK